MKKYKFFEDAGHGWLEVPRKDVAEVGQEGTISGYSYQHNDKVYLEEDGDMSMFLRALENAGIEYEYKTVYHDESPVREYERYRMRVIL